MATTKPLNPANSSDETSINGGNSYQIFGEEFLKQTTISNFDNSFVTVVKGNRPGFLSRLFKSDKFSDKEIAFNKLKKFIAENNTVMGMIQLLIKIKGEVIALKDQKMPDRNSKFKEFLNAMHKTVLQQLQDSHQAEIDAAIRPQIESAYKRLRDLHEKLLDCDLEAKYLLDGAKKVITKARYELHQAAALGSKALKPAIQGKQGQMLNELLLTAEYRWGLPAWIIPAGLLEKAQHKLGKQYIQSVTTVETYDLPPPENKPSSSAQIIRETNPDPKLTAELNALKASNAQLANVLSGPNSHKYFEYRPLPMHSEPIRAGKLTQIELTNMLRNALGENRLKAVSWLLESNEPKKHEFIFDLLNNYSAEIREVAVVMNVKGAQAETVAAMNKLAEDLQPVKFAAVNGWVKNNAKNVVFWDNDGQWQAYCRYMYQPAKPSSEAVVSTADLPPLHIHNATAFWHFQNYLNQRSGHGSGQSLATTRRGSIDTNFSTMPNGSKGAPTPMVPNNGAHS